LIHAFKITPGGVAPVLGWMAAPEFAAAYAATGICLLALHWMKRFDTAKN